MKKTHQRLSFPLIMGGSLLSFNALADQAYNLDNVIVTASRTSETTEQTLAATSVITREDIVNSQATSVPELLSKTPGIAVSESGGLGSQTSIFLRGTNSNQTVVLVDGVRVNGAGLGSIPWQYLNPDQIQRIEIVRGPQSSLYGADAIGGVIQIFTRKGKGKPKWSVKAGVGSDSTQTLSANYGGQIKKTAFNLSASQISTAGYNFTNHNYYSDSGYNRDKDGFHNSSFAARISHEFANQQKAGFSVSHNEGKNEYDDFTPLDAYTFFQTTAVSTYYSQPLTQNWDTKLSAGYYKDNQRSLAKSIPESATFNPYEYGTKRYELTWKNEINWRFDQLLTAGLEYTDEKATGSDYEDYLTGEHIDSRYNKAVFLQNLSQFGKTDLKLGLRYDDNEAYGGETTGNLAWSIELPKQMRLIASYGKAFRAPTFSDLYYPMDAWGNHGNPNLKPETAYNKELALRGHYSHSKWSVAAFQNDIDDLIVYGGDTSYNVNKARIRGLETSYTYSQAKWYLTTSLTLLDPKSRSTDNMLPRRPRQRLVIDGNRDLGQFSLGATLTTQSHTYDMQDSNSTIPGFYTVEIRGQYHVTKNITTEMKVVNLMDRNYEKAKGYRSQPRGVLFSVTYVSD